MKSKSIGEHKNFLLPATYSIQVEGLLDERWSDRLAGMHIKIIKKNHAPLVTILSGQLTDQAELLGVLNALYNLRVTLIDVRRQDIPGMRL